MFQIRSGKHLALRHLRCRRTHRHHGRGVGLPLREGHRRPTITVGIEAPKSVLVRRTRFSWTLVWLETVSSISVSVVIAVLMLRTRGRKGVVEIRPSVSVGVSSSKPVFGGSASSYDAGIAL